MLLVHIEHPSPRATYIVRHVLERMLGIPVRTTTDLDAFRGADGPKLQYGAVPVEGAEQVPWSGALDALPEGDPPMAVQQGMQVLFPVGDHFDLFAAAFFLLSLADELRCSARDAHDRIPAAALFTVRAGLAGEPWVDHWALALGARLESRWPGMVERPRQYRHRVTVDMDNVLRYAGRPLHRVLGASAKDLLHGRAGAVIERFLVRSGLRRDPYVQAIDLVERHARSLGGPILFFLTEGEGAHDHAVPPARWPGYLRRHFDRPQGNAGLRYGIHPSYRSSTDERRHWREAHAFEMDLRLPREATRQHYLRWTLPGTLRHVADMGFKEEHTLGFPDRPGFRVCTCTPFLWYDLEKDRATELELWPFHAMDSALVERMGQGPAEVVRTMNAMSDRIRAVNGTFVSVWHDRYLSGHREFAPWPAVFEQVIEHARS